MCSRIPPSRDEGGSGLGIVPEVLTSTVVLSLGALQLPHPNGNVWGVAWICGCPSTRTTHQTRVGKHIRNLCYAHRGQTMKPTRTNARTIVLAARSDHRHGRAREAGWVSVCTWRRGRTPLYHELVATHTRAKTPRQAPGGALSRGFGRPGPADGDGIAWPWRNDAAFEATGIDASGACPTVGGSTVPSSFDACAAACVTASGGGIRCAHAVSARQGPAKPTSSRPVPIDVRI